MMRSIRAAIAFYWVFGFKIASAFTQIYLLSMIATNGSSEEPFLGLRTIAHLGALAAGLRAIDALIDPAFQKLNPFRGPDATALNGESGTVETKATSTTTVTKDEPPIVVDKEP